MKERERERGTEVQKIYILKTLWGGSPKLKRNINFYVISTVLELSDYSYNTYIKAVPKPGKGSTQHNNCGSVSLINIDDK